MSGNNRQQRGVCVVALSACMLMCGCGQPEAEPELGISDVRTWKIPAADHFLPAPRGLASDAENNVLVLDDAGRVLVYDSTGSLQRMWSMPDNSIGNPEGICRLQDGRIAVADTHYHRIVIFRDGGEVDEMFGSEGNGPGEFVFPVAIAQAEDGSLYVGEYGDHQRVQKFTAEGDYILEFGQHGTGPGEFQRPSGLDLHGGSVFVVDAFNDRIQVFSLDGEYQRTVQLPEGSAPLEYPYDLRVLSSGQIYVIENKAARLTLLADDGMVIGRFGSPGRDLSQFYQPWDLTVLTDGRILVADTGNHRLVELKP